MAWPVPGTAGVAGVRGYLWVRVLGGLREVALPCSVNVRACCMGVFSVRSGPVAVVCPGCGWGESYSSCGRAPIADCVFCGWPSPVARCAAGFLLRGCVLGCGRALLWSACSVGAWGLFAWHVPCFGSGFILFVIMWISSPFV